MNAYKQISDIINKYCAQYKVDNVSDAFDVELCSKNGRTCASYCEFGNGIETESVCILKRTLEILENEH